MMLTPNQTRCTRNGATALNAAARLLNEAVGELAGAPVVATRDWAKLNRTAQRLSIMADAVNAKAVKKDVFTSTPA